MDETLLIKYITANHPKGRDGMNFDKTFWVSIADSMANHACSGAPKTPVVCQLKWAWLQSLYDVVHKVANTSGLSYSLENGASITAESESMWADFVKKNPKAKSLKDKGWKHYNSLKGLIPVKTANVTVTLGVSPQLPTCPLPLHGKDRT
ncbi:hypothetical protein BDR06DRAFT_1062817 [Suillus hirtellus]|nr:hypothetical protein BDR06DRAFT_1062817 [Suillus hirtellus]